MRPGIQHVSSSILVWFLVCNPLSHNRNSNTFFSISIGIFFFFFFSFFFKNFFKFLAVPQILRHFLTHMYFSVLSHFLFGHKELLIFYVFLSLWFLNTCLFRKGFVKFSLGIQRDRILFSFFPNCEPVLCLHVKTKAFYSSFGCCLLSFQRF